MLVLVLESVVVLFLFLCFLPVPVAEVVDWSVELVVEVSVDFLFLCFFPVVVVSVLWVVVLLDDGGLDGVCEGV